MPHLEENKIAEIVLSDISELREDFRPWRDRAQKWVQMLDPHAGQVDRSTPGVIQSTNETSKKSQYLTNFFSSGIRDIGQLLTSSDPIISIAILDQDEAEIEKTSLVESFCRGVLNYLNAQTADSGRDVSWMREVMQYPLILGKIIGIPHMIDKGNGEVEVEWPLFDPSMCYHDFGNCSPRRFVCEYYERGGVAENQLRRLYDQYPDAEVPRAAERVKWSEKIVKMAQYWLEDYYPGTGTVVMNGLVIDDQLVFLRQTKFKRWPVKIISVGGGIGTSRNLPEQAGNNSDYYIRNHALSLLVDAEHIYPVYDQAKSLEMDNLSLMLSPILIEKSEDGDLFLLPNEVAPGKSVALRSGQFLEFLQHRSDAGMAEGTIIAGLEREMRHVIPDRLRSGSPADTGSSGYLYFQERQAAEKRILSHAQAPHVFIEQGLQELIAQFQEMDGNPRIKLDATTRKGQRMGQFFYKSFGKDDIPKATILRVKSGVLLPEDDLRALQIAQMAQAAGIDNFTIMDQILKYPDPIQIARRFQEQQVEMSPEFQELRKLNKFRQLADVAQGEAERVAKDNGPESKEAMAAKKMAIIAKSNFETFQSLLMGRIQGQGSPSAPGGIPPQIQPPEQRGFESPDQQLAVMGQTPSPQSRTGSQNGRQGA